MSIDDPNVSIENEDVIYGRQKINLFTKKKKLNFDKKNFTECKKEEENESEIFCDFYYDNCFEKNEENDIKNDNNNSGGKTYGKNDKKNGESESDYDTQEQRTPTKRNREEPSIYPTEFKAQKLNNIYCNNNREDAFGERGRERGGGGGGLGIKDGNVV